jgi:hypothetical protein
MAGIFKAMMLFCALIWIWGLALIKIWPWQTGGEWLPEFPIVAVCSGSAVCAVPYGDLAKAKADGRLQSLEPPTESGETAYELLTLQWKRLNGGIETKVSAWNFQTTVRYRIENDLPVLVEYQEISGKVFLLAIGGALVTLIGIYLRKLRK